jgi:hypothetical protein
VQHLLYLNDVLSRSSYIGHIHLEKAFSSSLKVRVESFDMHSDIRCDDDVPSRGTMGAHSFDVSDACRTRSVVKDQ